MIRCKTCTWLDWNIIISTKNKMMQDSTRYQRRQGRYLTGGKSTSKYVQINWELVESQKVWTD